MGDGNDANQTKPIETLPNGRDIRLRADGRFEVQPADDNYWIIVDTIEQARDAYEHPENYRCE